MKKVTITLEDYLYEFYQKIGENAGGISSERVMADALFKLAGGLSLNVVKQKKGFPVTPSGAIPFHGSKGTRPGGNSFLP